MSVLSRSAGLRTFPTAVEYASIHIGLSKLEALLLAFSAQVDMRAPKQARKAVLFLVTALVVRRSGVKLGRTLDVGLAVVVQASERDDARKLCAPELCGVEVCGVEEGGVRALRRGSGRRFGGRVFLEDPHSVWGW